MRPELELGKLEGRLECPKCKCNVGKYAWQGMQCSCGDWVIPGISLAKGRVDQIRSRSTSTCETADEQVYRIRNSNPPLSARAERERGRGEQGNL